MLDVIRGACQNSSARSKTLKASWGSSFESGSESDESGILNCRLRGCVLPKSDNRRSGSESEDEDEATKGGGPSESLESCGQAAEAAPALSHWSWIPGVRMVGIPERSAATKVLLFPG